MMLNGMPGVFAGMHALQRLLMQLEVCADILAVSLPAGGELFEQLSAKGYYRERDAAHIMRTVLQVRTTSHSRGSAAGCSTVCLCSIHGPAAAEACQTAWPTQCLAGLYGGRFHTLPKQFS